MLKTTRRNDFRVCEVVHCDHKDHLIRFPSKFKERDVFSKWKKFVLVTVSRGIHNYLTK